MPKAVSTPNKKAPLKQVAYDFIKEKILSCEFEPGALLNEQQLCEATKLSRTPVRDALVRLEQEGFVTILPKKGIKVSDLQLHDINRIFEARLLLEPYALRNYGHRLDRKELKEFRKILLKSNPASLDLAQCFDLDDRLHNCIVRAMNNRFLLATYDNISELNRRLRVLSGSKVQDRMQDTFDEHLAIIDACLEEDWESAANQLAKHLESSKIASFYLIMDNYDEY